MIKEKLRQDINDTYKWDLTPIYKSDKDFYTDYELVILEINRFKDYKGIILATSDNLYNLMKLYFKVNQIIDKLYLYANLNHDADGSNDNYKIMVGKVMNLVQCFSEQTAYINPELLKKDYAFVINYYMSNSKLKEYDNYFKEVFRYKKHILSNNEEKIISALSNAFDAPKKIYTELKDVDLKLGYIKDEKGNKVELTNHNYTTYLASPDRLVRKQAFKKMYSGYKKIANTMATTYYSDVDNDVKLAELKKYDSSLGMALYGDNLDSKIYSNLIKVVNNNIDKLVKYYDLRKKELKLDELHLYDIYNDLVAEKISNYSFEEAKDMVIEALSVLGEDYIANIKEAFNNKWIDIYSNKYKRSGAYSSSCYDVHPYVLLNYQGKLDDISTIAHELGHAMHSYYANKCNNYVDANYRIFVAEVASTVNELLFYNYVLKNSKDKKQKLLIINKLLDLYKGTIYRQTMFAEFEMITHDKVQNKEILTSDLIAKIYYDLNKKYFGKNVIVDKDIRYEWARIPHFYYFFYVYKYATGLSIATYLAKKILNNDQKAIDAYLTFLKNGGKYYPDELLKLAGVDIYDESIFKEAINYFDDLINQFNAVKGNKDE